MYSKERKQCVKRPCDRREQIQKAENRLMRLDGTDKGGA